MKKTSPALPPHMLKRQLRKSGKPVRADGQTTLTIGLSSDVRKASIELSSTMKRPESQLWRSAWAHAVKTGWDKVEIVD